MKRLSLQTILIACICLLIVSCKKKDDTTNAAPAIVFDCNHSDITTAVVWDNVNDNVDYIVNCEVKIQTGGSLTIKPGVHVQFVGGDAGINVIDGSLNAVGTAANPIVLAGQHGTQGEWKGVYCFSNNSANQLSYVTIRDAGSAKWDTDLETAGLVLANYGGTCRVSVDNCSLKNNAGFGLWLRDSDDNLFSFTHNLMDSNTTYPVRVFCSQLGKLDATSNYLGTGHNGKGMIYLSGDQTYEQDLTIASLGAPYYVSNYFNDIDFTHVVTVQPGANLFFAADFKMTVTGTLVANGTSAQPIIFRGLLDNTQGTWAGILLTNDNNNVLTQCTIDGGGATELTSGTKANLCIGEAVGPNGKATLTNCIFKNSGGYGFGSKTAAVLSQTGSTFTNNLSGASTTY